MIRDPLCNKSYWDNWVRSADTHIRNTFENIKVPAVNLDYEPQYVANLSQENYEQIIRRYSRGDAIAELAAYFPPILNAWEQAEQLGASVWSDEVKYIRHTWAVNFDCYHGHFWKISLALLLDIPEDQWQRLIALVGNEGEDILLDRLIATRSPGRKIGSELCFPKPYARLLAAMDAPRDKQAKLLKGFVDHWFKELGQFSKQTRVPQLNPYKKTYWYNFALPPYLDGGAYFGQWCLEAAAVAKAFAMDESLCLGHRHYPGDFLRPNGPTTHPERPDVLPASATSESVPPPEKPRGWLSRLLGKH